MAVVPVFPDFSDGVLTSAKLDQTAAAGAFLMAPPIAELRQTVAQSLTTSVFTGITFDAEDLDFPAGQHDTSVDPSRFIAIYPGVYHFDGGVGFAASATGRRGTQWAVNGTPVNGTQTLVPTTATGTCEIPARGKNIYLNVGDYVELQGFQDTGGALLTSIATSNQSNMAVFRVSN